VGPPGGRHGESTTPEGGRQHDTAPLPVQPRTVNPWAPFPADPPAAAQRGTDAPRGPSAASWWSSSTESPNLTPYPMPQPPPGGRDPHPRRRGVPGVVVALLMLVSLLLGVVLGLGGARVLDEGVPQASGRLPSVTSSGTVVSRAPDSVAEIAASVLPGVVYIEVRGAGAQTSGSGFVIREDGYLLTNNHVVAGAGDGDITVVFSDGSQESAEIVGRTADYDLAVVKVDRNGLTPLPLGDSDAVKVGDPVVAVGAPLGLEGTVTSGIVSALNRSVSAGDATTTAFINAIQTDAAINPGNSGGPLVNLAGEVIGINTAIAQAAGSADPGNIGLGFAIPSSQARRTAEEIIETGRATYPIIGVVLDSSYDGEGVRVAPRAQAGQEPVTPDGPADAAGIEPGDVIRRIDGMPVTEPDELIVAIRARAPGQVVTLTIERDGREREVRVTLGEAESR
jgi:putative serine protease PepD